MTKPVAWKFSVAGLLVGALLVPAAVRVARPPEVTEERVKAALPALEKLAAQTLTQTGVPGMAIAVVYQDRPVYLKGFGVREAGRDAPVDPDTIFQIASVSKPVTTTIVARLVGEGLVKWDDPIIKHDPQFRMHDPYVTREVTLRDFFAHRSGLPDHIGDLLEDIGSSREEVLTALRYVPTENNFRSQYAYTNFGFTEAAVAAAKAAGKSWEDVAAEKLYRPLGMKQTSSRLADLLAAPNRARGHVLVGGKYVAKYQREPDAQSPAGGVSSTVRDLAQWMRLHLAAGKLDGQQLIAAAALAETHRPQIINHSPDNPATDRAGLYGLGWNVSYDTRGRVRLGHSGGFEQGAATAVYLLPAEGLGIVVLTNAAPIGVPEAISVSFLDLVLEGKIERDYLAIFKPIFAAMSKPLYGTAVDYTKPPARPSPALPAEAYVGVYRNDYFGEIEIVAQGGGLVMRQGPKKLAFPMKHFDRDVFSYQPVGESAAGLSAVTFTVGPDQKATGVVVENLDVNGLGKFTRAAVIGLSNQNTSPHVARMYGPPDSPRLAPGVLSPSASSIRGGKSKPTPSEIASVFIRVHLRFNA